MTTSTWTAALGQNATEMQLEFLSMNQPTRTDRDLRLNNVFRLGWPDYMTALPTEL